MKFRGSVLGLSYSPDPSLPAFAPPTRKDLGTKLPIACKESKPYTVIQKAVGGGGGGGGGGGDEGCLTS